MQMQEQETLDNAVRLHIYRRVVETGTAPSVGETADALSVPSADVAASYRRLDASHALVLTPGTLDVRMANPFSTVPTSFRVEARDGAWWGNCIWDALGISAALQTDARISTRCGDCGESLVVEITDGVLVPTAGIVHFAIPAAKWWDDIIYT